MANIQIQVLSVTTETKPTAKGSYQQLEVAYKNLTFQGKVESKKIMSFGAQKDVFPVLATASGGSVYEVEVVKNDKGYNDWIKVTKSDGAVSASAPAASTKVSNSLSGAAPATTKGTWETPEERAKKQIYIVRQSSISAAIAMLTPGRKNEIKPEEVIGIATTLEAFVFGTDAVADVVAQDLGGIDTMAEDIPF